MNKIKKIIRSLTASDLEMLILKELIFHRPNGVMAESLIRRCSLHNKYSWKEVSGCLENMIKEGFVEKFTMEQKLYKYDIVKI